MKKNIVIVEGVDYYTEPGGRMVFTEEYHLKRGYCCNGRCRHCPWKKPSRSVNQEHRFLSGSSPSTSRLLPGYREGPPVAIEQAESHPEEQPPRLDYENG
jgi:hypothetical protein